MNIDKWDIIIFFFFTWLCLYIVIKDRAEHGRHEYQRGLNNGIQAMTDLRKMNIWREPVHK